MNYTNNEIHKDKEGIFRFCDYSNERSILSKALKSEDHFYTLISKVSAEDFLAEDTRQTFLLMKLLHESGVRSFDIPIMLKVAEETGMSSNYTKDFLEALLIVEVSDNNFELYLKKLVDDSTKFKLYNDLLTNTAFVFDNADSLSAVPSNDLLSKVQSDLLTLSTESMSVAEPKHIGEGLDEYIQSIQDEKVEMMGISTGYPILDKAIDGLIPATLMIIAARKKMGKSAILTNIATHVAVHNGGSVLYIDTEMSFHEWRDRVISIISGVEERVIKHGGFKSEAAVYDKIMNAIDLLNKSKLFHFYLPGFSLDKISALYKKYHIKENITLGVFDYIKAPESTDTTKGKQEHQILGDVTTKLKDLSGMLDIPFLAAVQLNRSGDVADSDRIARYGDIVAFWGLRDKKQAEEEAWDLAKTGFYGLSIKDSRRGGRTGSAGIGFQFYHSRLTIKEVDIEDQIEKSNNNENIDTGNVGMELGGVSYADKLV